MTNTLQYENKRRPTGHSIERSIHILPLSEIEPQQTWIAERLGANSHLNQINQLKIFYLIFAESCRKNERLLSAFLRQSVFACSVVDTMNDISFGHQLVTLGTKRSTRFIRDVAGITELANIKTEIDPCLESTEKASAKEFKATPNVSVLSKYSEAGLGRFLLGQVLDLSSLLRVLLPEAYSLINILITEILDVSETYKGDRNWTTRNLIKMLPYLTDSVKLSASDEGFRNPRFVMNMGRPEGTVNVTNTFTKVEEIDHSLS